MYYGDGGLGAGGGAMEITPELALYHQMMGVNGSPQFELEDMSYEALLQLEDVKVGVGEAFLNSMPVIIYEPSDKEEECPVCLTPYEAGEALTVLLCTHRFHLDCCQTWLKDNKSCPVCKVDPTQEPEVPENL
jgi:hypothetical protein